MANKRSGDTDGTNKPARKSSKVGGVDNAEFRGYINLNLSDEQKAAFVKWNGSDAPWNAFEYQIQSGVNVSVKRTLADGGFLASATQRDATSPNAGLVVTARASSPSVAWGRVLYILTILSEGERWEDTQPMANPDRW